MHSAVSSKNILRMRYGFRGLWTSHSTALVSPRRSEDRDAATREMRPLDLGCRRDGGKVCTRTA